MIIGVLYKVLIHLKHLHPKLIYKIAKKARDVMGNNLLHLAVAATNEFHINFFIEIFPKDLLNCKNIYGETPLHFAKTPNVKKLLIKYGSHPDCQDLNNVYVEYVCNLQCIAARSIPTSHFKYVPNYFSPIVELHQAKYRLYKQLDNNKTN